MKKNTAIIIAITVISLAAAFFGGSGKPALAEDVPPADIPSADNPAPKKEAYSELPDNEVVMYIGSTKAYINGVEKRVVEGENAAPYLSGGKTLVPVRFVAEAFGVETVWDAKTRTATINAGGKEILVTGSEMREGRLYVPLRYIAETLGKQVFYERGLIVISNDALSFEKDKNAVATLTARFTGLERVGSKERLIELLKLQEPRIEPYGDFDGGLVLNEAARDTATLPAPSGTAAAPAAPAAAASEQMKQAEAEAAPAQDSVAGTGYSTTNVQVQGIDEADIIKTDGEYIYYARAGKIEIVKANADGTLELMSEITVNGGFGEFFIDANRIITIGSGSGSYSPDSPIMPLARIAEVDMAYPSGGGVFSKAVVYDTTDKRNPKVERSVEVKGNFNSARKIGKSIYFVATNYVYYSNDNLTPLYRDSAAGGKDTEIGWDRVYCFPIITTNSITSIAGFNIDEPKTPANIETFVGAGDNIYMSQNALYIANSNYFGGGDSNKTEIYKFAASNGEIVYQSKGSVPGMLINQFAMDEYNGYFRVGTTVDYYGGGDIRRSSVSRSNSLYVLDGGMSIVGKIEDIAPLERIYSVRFMGNRAYMVTFKQVDPLFAIDVSNPREPKIMGALKIPGYSDYLHPYDENHLIGFGKDTTTDEYGNAFYLGMKLSLFDITDISNPKEMFTEFIGDRGTESPLLYDHKALLFDKARDLLAFPVTLYERKTTRNETLPNGSEVTEYGYFANSFAYVYNINLKDGFKLRGRVSHMSDSDLLKSSQWAADPAKYIERVLTIGNRLYAASQKYLTSSELNTLKGLGRLEFN